jgi:hypothetical protein
MRNLPRRLLHTLQRYGGSSAALAESDGGEVDSADDAATAEAAKEDAAAEEAAAELVD